MELLGPLLPFAHLEEVVFRLEDYLPLRDEELSRVFNACPNLHTLLFIQSNAALSDPGRQPGSVELTTLAGLVELAPCCPHVPAHPPFYYCKAYSYIFAYYLKR